MKIAEVSERCGISADTLRFYERSGLVRPVARDRGGQRDYRESDVMRIEFILCMRKAGLPIDVLKTYVDLVDQGENTLEERIQLLGRQRDELLARRQDLQKTLDLLDHKLELYQNKLRDAADRRRPLITADGDAQRTAYAAQEQPSSIPALLLERARPAERHLRLGKR